MASKSFYVDFNVTGSERKRLVTAISKFVATAPRYLGAPSFAYEVGCFTIDKYGRLSFDNLDAAVGLVDELTDQGFISQESNLDDEVEETATNANVSRDSNSGLTVSFPIDYLDPVALNNLHSIIGAKGILIRKALGIELLPVVVGVDQVSFPWFTEALSPDEVKAYSDFISALCKMAHDSKRINSREKEVENEKYAFRCFLLRLGFIGPDYKVDRKILLKRLHGSSAFKSNEKGGEVDALPA